MMPSKFVVMLFISILTLLSSCCYATVRRLTNYSTATIFPFLICSITGNIHRKFKFAFVLCIWSFPDFLKKFFPLLTFLCCFLQCYVFCSTLTSSTKSHLKIKMLWIPFLYPLYQTLLQFLYFLSDCHLLHFLTSDLHLHSWFSFQESISLQSMYTSQTLQL